MPATVESWFLMLPMWLVLPNLAFRFIVGVTEILRRWVTIIASLNAMFNTIDLTLLIMTKWLPLLSDSKRLTLCRTPALGMVHRNTDIQNIPWESPKTSQKWLHINEEF